MAVIHLLRHAKSSWEQSRLDDHERPLAPRGERAAAAVGMYMRQEGIAPDLVICSTARRARETLAIIAGFLPDKAEIRYDEGIYEAPATRLMELCVGAGDGVEELLVIGHNPGIHSFASHLVGAGGAGAIGRMRLKFPTGALASIELPGPLSDLHAGRGQLLRFSAPKQLV